MFVDCQNFAASWGHKFVDNWFVADSFTLLNVRGDVNSCVRKIHEN